MKSFLAGGAAALALFSLSSPLLAQDVPDDTITVDAPLLHPAAGMMNEHMHEGGEIMIGLRVERTHAGGTNRSGTDAISDTAILAAGYTARTQSMDMDMAMLDLMYAPTPNLTLMVMPMYMRHTMTMVGIDPMAGMGGSHGGSGGGHGGHTSIGYGMAHEHSAEGFGDTLVSASYRLARSPSFGAHATLGVWVPTGAIDKTNADGTFVHYGMQPGSGTWDVEPSVTVHGRSGAMGWGAQGAYRWRSRKENDSGFSFGDIARATAWGSYLMDSSLGVTGRVAWRHEGMIQGHYNAGHNHAAPPDRQANYGGDLVEAGFGLNWALPITGTVRPQIGTEIALPLYQDPNGIQAPQKWRLSLAVSQAF